MTAAEASDARLELLAKHDRAQLMKVCGVDAERSGVIGGDWAYEVLGELGRKDNPLLEIVVGDGANFVRTMARLADTGVSPSVVDDQLGARLAHDPHLAVRSASTPIRRLK